MLYLEDYLEMIEHLPQELRDRFTEMRELDLTVQNNMDSLEKRVRLLFGSCRRGDITTENANEDFRDIRSTYNKTLEDADEKLQLANQVYELVERYLRRLDTELYKFKCELEADNKGITELLEKRSLELDAPTTLGQSSQTSHHKENRYRVRAEKRRESWGGSGSTVTGTALARGSDSSAAGLGMGGVGMGLGSGVPSSGGLGLGGASRSAEGRTLVAATAPLALSRTDSAIQAALGRGVTEANSPSYSLGHMGAGNAIAAAASQAIAATQQMQQGRRTASLKASYEAIHSNSSSNAGVGGNELQVGRELAGAAQQALHAAANNLHEMTSLPLLPSAASHVPSSSSGSTNKRHKKKASYGGSSSNMLHSQIASLASSVSRSSSPTPNVGSVGVSNAAPITSMPLEEALTDGEWTYDPNEPRYCICNQVSYGDMVACDNEDCPYEWFHYPCVSITAPPKGKWFCPQCQANSRRRGNRKN